MRRAAVVAVGFVLAAAFYLLLIDTTDSPELYAMIGVVLLAGGAFAVSVRVEAPRFDARSLLRGWGALCRIPVDVVVVSREAFAQLLAPRQRARGHFRTVPFDGGPGDVAAEEYFGSLAPNQVVLDVDGDKLLVHELRSRRDS
jgi:hypothetical protein